MGKPIVHFEINVKDGTKAGKFYSELFGWKVDANNPMQYGLVDTDSGGRGINGGVAGNQEHNGVTVYVEVDDLQAHLDRAVQLGGKVVVPPTEIPNMVTFALFTDPDGNQIGMVKG